MNTNLLAYFIILFQPHAPYFYRKRLDRQGPVGIYDDIEFLIGELIFWMVPDTHPFLTQLENQPTDVREIGVMVLGLEEVDWL